MGTEDLDAWDATLQSCLGRVLDEGADTARVLDHVAGTIASTHIPTGASATRAADILLGHLETPHEAPALLGFVNDTLVSTYPPEPRNKVASMWLMRTVKKVVGTCPGRMLREVVAALQEGLSVWVADQYRVFTAEEYAFDVGGSLFLTHLGLPSLTAGCRSFRYTRRRFRPCSRSAHVPITSKLWARCWRPVLLVARTNRRIWLKLSKITGT